MSPKGPQRRPKRSQEVFLGAPLSARGRFERSLKVSRPAQEPPVVSFYRGGLPKQGKRRGGYPTPSQHWEAWGIFFSSV